MGCGSSTEMATVAVQTDMLIERQAWKTKKYDSRSTFDSDTEDELNFSIVSSSRRTPTRLLNSKRRTSDYDALTSANRKRNGTNQVTPSNNRNGTYSSTSISRRSSAMVEDEVDGPNNRYVAPTKSKPTHRSVPPLFQNEQSTRPSSKKTSEYVYEDAELYEVYRDLSPVLDDYKECVHELKKHKSSSYYNDMYDTLYKKVLMPYKDCEHKDEQRLLAYHMAKIGFARAVTNYYEYILDDLDIRSFTGKNFGRNSGVRLLCLIRQIVDRFTGANRKLGYKFGQADFLSFMVDDLKSLKRQLSSDMDEGAVFALQTALGVLFSCSKSESNMVYYKDLDVATYTEPFIKSKEPEIKTAALLVLASIVEEEHSPSVVNDESIFEFLLESLDSAVHSATKQYRGYTTLDLTLGLTKIAVTDKVKRIVLEKGGITIFMEMLKNGDTSEREAAALAVWTIAFTKDNREKLKENKRLLSVLERVREAADSSAGERAAATGALWLLRDQDNYINTIEKRKRQRKRMGANPHVMISYNWAEQKIPMKMKQRLTEAGYSVWIYAEHMDEPMPAARVDAVENAAVVIVCMSHKYKQGQNNRTEADYAYELGKTMEPVLIQSGYKPDGWLRNRVGKSYIDFTKSSSFEKGIKSLIEKLDDSGKRIGRSADANDWSYREVMQWLGENNLDREPKLHSLSGSDVSVMQDVHDRNPQTFNRYVRQNYGITDRDVIYDLNMAVGESNRA